MTFSPIFSFTHEESLEQVFAASAAKEGSLVTDLQSFGIFEKLEWGREVVLGDLQVKEGGVEVQINKL